MEHTQALRIFKLYHQFYFKYDSGHCRPCTAAKVMFETCQIELLAAPSPPLPPTCVFRFSISIPVNCHPTTATKTPYLRHTVIVEK